MATISVTVSDANKAEFEAFLKKLPTSQTPNAGDRLFRLAIGTFEQRAKNLQMQKENREILKKYRAQQAASGAKS